MQTVFLGVFLEIFGPSLVGAFLAFLGQKLEIRGFRLLSRPLVTSKLYNYAYSTQRRLFAEEFDGFRAGGGGINPSLPLKKRLFGTFFA